MGAGYVPALVEAQMPMGGPPPGMMGGPVIIGRIAAGAGPAANAEITLTNQANGKIRKTRANQTGFYNISDLRAGMYSIRVEAAGFKSVVLKDVKVADGPAFADAHLEAGSPTETVTVQWKPGGPPMGAKPAAASEGKSGVKETPLSSRNFTAEAATADGVSGGVNNASTVGVALSVGFQVGGSNTNNFMTDGVSLATSFAGVTAPGIPNPDTIQMNAIEPWSYSAGPGRYSGVNIMATTKSGSDLYHATFFEFNRNDIFNANEFFRKREAVLDGIPNLAKRPVLKQNQFGVTFGGPLPGRQQLGKFFVAYQGTRQSNSLAPGGTAPSVYLPPFPQTRTAASLGAVFAGQAGAFGSICISPTNCFTVPTDTIARDGSNISPVAVKLLNLKLANGNFYIPGSGSATESRTVTYSDPAKFTEDQFMVNTDMNLTPKNMLSERFFFARDPMTNNFNGGPSSLPGSPSNQLKQSVTALLRLTTELSPELTNELRVSGQHDILNDTPTVPFKNSDAGITSLVSSIDAIDIINVMGSFQAGGNGAWDTNSANQYQLSEGIKWVKGRHAVRAAFEGELRQSNVTELGPARGQLTFFSIADFLLGMPSGPMGNGTPMSNVFSSSGPGGTAAFTGPNGVSHSYRYADSSLYAEDDFKLTRNLTVNLGVRWDFFGLPSDSTGNMTLFEPSVAGAYASLPSGGTFQGFVVPANFKGTLGTGVTRASSNSILPSSPKTNLVPRFGLAWKPFEKSDLTIKTGYGIFYDRPESAVEEMQTLTEAPYAATAGASGAANSSATLANPFPGYASGWGTPRAVNFALGTSSNLNIRTISANLKTPQTQKWNLEIDKRLPGSVDLTMTYAGAHSIHLQDTARQINEAQLASASNPVNGITMNTAANAALRVPYLGLGASGLDEQNSLGAAKYHTGQIAVGKFFPFGVNFHASYSFSKTLSNLGITMPPGGIMSTGTGMTMDSNDPLNTRQQYGPLFNISPQRFSLMYGWMEPYKFSGLKKTLFEGWGAFGMYVVQDGGPLTLGDSRGGSIYGGAGQSRAQYAVGMGPKDVATHGSMMSRINSGYFNPSAFTMPTIVSQDGGTLYGNSGVGIVSGPGQNNNDLSVSKRNKIGETTNFEFRVEFFNLFNHAQFGLPDLGVVDPVFGQISSTSVNPRLIQLGAKYSF